MATYSKQIINGFIESELEIFKHYFKFSMVEDYQDTRSLAIAMACYYFKPLLTIEVANKIVNFTNDVYRMKNYKTHGWYRISAFEAASYILKNDKYYADNLLEHVFCGQGWARKYIFLSAGLLCPFLHFSNEILRESTEKNTKYLHFFYESNIAFYLSCNGSNEEKKTWFYQLKKDCGHDLNAFFENLAKPSYLYNTSFFIDDYIKAKSYLLFKLICSSQIANFKPELFDTIALHFKLIWNLDESNPLNDPYFDFSFLKDTTASLK